MLLPADLEWAELQPQLRGLQLSNANTLLTKVKLPAQGEIYSDYSQGWRGPPFFSALSRTLNSSEKRKCPSSCPCESPTTGSFISLIDTRLAGNRSLFENSVRRRDLEFRHWSRFSLESRSIRTLTINRNTLSPKLTEICDLLCRTFVILYDKWGRIVVTGIFSPQTEIDCSNESIFTAYFKLSCQQICNLLECIHY